MQTSYGTTEYYEREPTIPIYANNKYYSKSTVYTTGFDDDARSDSRKLLILGIVFLVLGVVFFWTYFLQWAFYIASTVCFAVLVSRHSNSLDYRAHRNATVGKVFLAIQMFLYFLLIALTISGILAGIFVGRQK